MDEHVRADLIANQHVSRIAPHLFIGDYQAADCALAQEGWSVVNVLEATGSTR